MTFPHNSKIVSVFFLLLFKFFLYFLGSSWHSKIYITHRHIRRVILCKQLCPPWLQPDRYQWQEQRTVVDYIVSSSRQLALVELSLYSWLLVHYPDFWLSVCCSMFPYFLSIMLYILGTREFLWSRVCITLMLIAKMFWSCGNELMLLRTACLSYLMHHFTSLQTKMLFLCNDTTLSIFVYVFFFSISNECFHNFNVSDSSLSKQLAVCKMV